MAGWARRCVPTTLRRELPASTRKPNGAPCMTFVKQAEQLAESAEVTEELRQQALSKEHAAKDLGGAALENQIRKNRFRWLREYLTEAG